ncbi:winged helix-turn-helix transcriptional regulator [Pseudoroseomonas wenyumeiae]
MRANLPGISANVLTQRLEGLEAAGILERRRLPPPASAQVYALTPWGWRASRSSRPWAAGPRAPLP